ncbi:MAG: hypothetical protein EOM76_12200, partial [Sphingobacteriia bacterium]|nr:hypothetical protein [Sphingobacteriia bacterium]
MKHKRIRINLKGTDLNGLSGINGLTGLGDMMPHTKAKIENNQRFFENMLNCPGSLKGDSDKLSFKEVLEKYNKGLSENQIKAWVYYKIKQGLPMTDWKNHVKVTDNDIPGLIASGAMFICGDEYQPLPVYAYGNMYEKQDQLTKDKDRIIKTYGKAVYEKHLEVIENNKPKQLKINDPEQSERPVIQVISKFAREESIFSIKTVRAEYLSVEKAEQLTFKAGKLVVKKNSSSSKYKPINIAFDGIKEYSLRDVFIKYLITLDRSEFKKTNATEITEYY